MAGPLVSIELEKMDTESLARLAGFDEVAGRQFVSAMAVVVAIGAKKTIADIREIANVQRDQMAGEVGGDFTPLAPIDANIAANRIKGAYESHGTMDIVGIVGDTSPGARYLRLVEKGRGPGGHPPAAKLQDWAERVLGVQPAAPRVTKKGKAIRDVSVGRALAHAIAQKGVKGHALLELVAAAIEGPVNAQFEAALVRIAGELGFK